MTAPEFIEEIEGDIETFRKDNPDDVELNESLERGLEDIKAGRVKPWSEIKHKRLVN